jgi:type IV secretory pathway component VirB8
MTTESEKKQIYLKKIKDFERSKALLFPLLTLIIIVLTISIMSLGFLIPITLPIAPFFIMISFAILVSYGIIAEIGYITTLFK